MLTVDKEIGNNFLEIGSEKMINNNFQTVNGRI